MNYKLQK